jgi:hypothetical protein
MSKQRNRQHHHAKSQRRGDHLELPTHEQFIATVPPRIIYPRGWKTKWQSEQAPLMLGTLIIMGGFVAIFLLAALILSLWPQ